MLPGSSQGCGDRVEGRAVLLPLALGQFLCSFRVSSFSHTLPEWKALAHGITALPARCSPSILVLWFTSLSDSSVSGFKGVLALLQPLATQGELLPAWRRCSGSVLRGMCCLFPALAVCWNSVSFSAGVAVAGSPWMGDNGPLAHASRHFHSFILEKENTSV